MLVGRLVNEVEVKVDEALLVLDLLDSEIAVSMSVVNEVEVKLKVYV